MSGYKRLRSAIVMASLALLVTAGLVLPQWSRLDGLNIDGLFWLRQQLFEPPISADPSPTVVIALDEESYQRPPLRQTPKVMWTPHLAKVLGAILDADVAVVGFDLIFPTSVGSAIKGFDKPFLQMLHRGARDGRVVLGQVQHRSKPLLPHPSQRLVVGGAGNLRYLNVMADPDEVIRRLPLWFNGADPEQSDPMPSMAMELLQRSGRPTVSVEQDPLILNFDRPYGAIPQYSFADLLACAEQGNADFFRRHFANRIVLFGTVLDVEDRKLSSKRYSTGNGGLSEAPRCVYPLDVQAYGQGETRDLIPGVLIHATAVNNLLSGTGLMSVGPLMSAGLILVLLLMVVLAMYCLSTPGALVATLVIGCAWVVLGGWLFAQLSILPLTQGLLGMALCWPLLSSYQTLMMDADRRFIRKVFSYYLSAEVVERLVASERLPKLGGESREVSILFSDIARFTTLSEQLDAQGVATFLNSYLSDMSDIIEQQQGFIEKFVADEITAVFGAPVHLQDHAVRAVQVALDSREMLASSPGVFGLPERVCAEARFGVNSGEMLVGNMGSRRRFNYAAMGDAANLGSRLEGANKFYGTTILVGCRTRQLCGELFLFREIDTIRVVGRSQPETIYEPLARMADATEVQIDLCSRFAAGLAFYHQRKYSQALDSFTALESADPVARIYSERCRRLLQQPPALDWDGVTDLTSK